MVKKWTNDEIQYLKDNLNKTYEELSFLLNRSKQSIRGKIRKINYNSSNARVVSDINWEEIQYYYNNDKTWDSVINKYNINYNIINNALKLGIIKSRSRSNASILSQKLKPRIVSEETKKKISIGRIKYLTEHPDQVPYLLNHYSKGDSYPEIYFDNIFKNNNLNYEKYLQLSIYQLDFAFIKNGINIEIDGEQHYVDNRIVESNIRKDIFLKEKGWEVIRIRWSYYQKMKKVDKEKYINDLVGYINKKNINIPILVSNKHYCIDCGKEVFKTSTRCSKCNGIRNINKNIPPLEQLLNDVKELGYCGTGRKYGVSDNCIRKRIKNAFVA